MSGRRTDTCTDLLRRAVPGTPQDWVAAVGQVSGLLLVIAGEESDGRDMPAPLRRREALRAWARLKTSILAGTQAPERGRADADDGTRPLRRVVVPAADVTVLGAAARVLGRHHLCLDPADSHLAAILHREAAFHGIAPGRLLAHLARVHGVLDIDPSVHGDDPVRANVAGRRLTVRGHRPVRPFQATDPAPDRKEYAVTDPEHVRTLIRRLEEAMNSRALDALDDILAEDFVRHCEATPDFHVRSREDFKQFLRSNTESFPDNVQTFTQVVVEGDRAGIWTTYEGTQTGALGRFPPSGRSARFDFGGVFRVADGKLAELWVTWDNMTILGQLGHLPAPEQPG